MAQNFLSSDRDQPMLLPPDLRDWLPQDHLAWFVIEAIEELDLDAFYSAYRQDGHGRAAHEPRMMLTLLAYAYAVGERSSRQIERRCREDVAFRVISANQVPDHATIARFRVRHERDRAAREEPVPRERQKRLEICRRRLVEDWRTEHRANRDYEAYRARGVMRDGRRFGRPPDPHTPPAQPEGKINLTDPDSKNMKAYRGYVQGYNAQAVTTRGQIIVAAEIAPDGLDFAQLDPMVEAAERELATAGVRERPEVVLADAGYWSNEHIDRLRERGITPLVAVDADRRKGPRKTRLGGPYDFMRRVLNDGKGADLYTRRQAMVEPVFADIKQNRRAGRFKRRGRAAVRSEWRLIAATHNLLKLHRHNLAAAGA